MLLAQATRALSGPDYWILCSYFVIMLGIGLYFYRFMRGMKDYFTGGNTIPWWLSGVSYWMSSFSAFAFVFYSALSYKYGMFGVTVYWVTVPATLFSLVFFANKWRRARIDSPVEFVETRYSPGLRQLFAWQGIPVKVIDDGLKIVAIGKFISIGLGLDMTQAMVWSSLIMLAYTFMGGLWAVAVTDFVQFVVMMAAVIILFPLAFNEAGGLVHFFQNTPAESLRLTNEKFSWVYISGLIVMYCLSFATNWSLIQRFYCVPTEKDARKVGWLVVTLNIVGPPMMFLPAMAARSFLPGLTDEAQVYPLMCAKLLPAGMFGLVIAAMFSATMSMLSGDYNVVASVLTNDVYRRLVRPDASGKELVLVGRVMTLVVGLLSLGIAFLLVGGKGEKQFQNMVTLFSIATAPVAVPLLLGLVSKRFNSAAAMMGFLAGLSVGLVIFFNVDSEVTWRGVVWQRENILVVCTLLTTFLTMVGTSLLVGTQPSETQRVEEFHARLALPIGALPADGPAHPSEGAMVLSPFRVVGVVIGLTGLSMLVVLPWISGTLALTLNLVISIGLIVAGSVMFRLSGKRCAARLPAGSES
jgi:SSS family transporter